VRKGAPGASGDSATTMRTLVWAGGCIAGQAQPVRYNRGLLGFAATWSGSQPASPTRDRRKRRAAL